MSKNDLPYFQHDNNSMEHAKMQALLTAYGFEGYGRFWALNEAIAASEDAKLRFSRRVNRLALAAKLRFTEEELDDFVKFLADPEVDLINLRDGIITTDRTQENLEWLKNERETNRKKYQKRAQKNYPGENQNYPVCTPGKNEFTPGKIDFTPGKPDKVNESKVNESKVNGGDLGDESEFDSPPPLFEKIQEEAGKAGFIIDQVQAQKIAESGLDPPWISGPYSFLQFVKHRLSTDPRYKGKPVQEMRLLFVAAFGWENLRKEYPPWREARLKADKAEAIKKARENPPDTCPKCGVKLGASGRCQACGGFYEWDEGRKEHVFQARDREVIDFTKALQAQMRDKIRPDEVPKRPEEIVF